MQVDRGKGRLSWMGAGKTFVPLGVPVLGGDNERVIAHAGIDGGNDGIAVRDRQGAAGHKVVLKVDKQEGTHDGLQLMWELYSAIKWENGQDSRCRKNHEYDNFAFASFLTT